MKSRVFSIALLLITTSLFSQSSSINYKAIIKDGGGNVVANQGVTVQFIIYKGAALTKISNARHETKNLEKLYNSY